MTLAASAPRSDLSRGVLYLFAAIVLFECMDTTNKFLAQSLPVAEVVWARFAFHLMAMVPVLLWAGPLRVAATQRAGLQFVRSLLLLTTTTLFSLALRYLPLATATAIAFTAPLLLTALSGPLLKETVGPKRWAAVIVGFAGVMVIVRPGGAAFNWAMLLPLAMAFANALYQLSTREISRTDSPLTTVFWTAAGSFAVISPAMPWVWQAPDTLGWVLLILFGTLGFFSHLLLILAFRAAPASALAPFNYMQLILAIPVSTFVFHDMPDTWMLAGSALICGSGLYVWSAQHHAPSAA